MKRFLQLLCIGFLALSCTHTTSGSLSEKEKMIINASDSVMYVLNVFVPADSVVLRSQCADFSDKELQSKDFKLLCDKMLATVNAPEQGGVGIAAPQVGIKHRVIVVCRMDLEGEPYCVYPNAHIDSLLGNVNLGPEGCLSIPPYRGNVPRYEGVIVSYKDPQTLDTKRDTVHGYTAIIFQHECDHLDGILYTDRADSVYVNEEWAAERSHYDSLGCYKRPKFLDE